MEMDMQKRRNTEWVGQPATVGDGAALEQEESGQDILERIWAERAARLAEAPTEEDVGEQSTLLIVRLGRELYGIDAQHVDRIEPVDVNGLTRVPRVPAWVAGVTNLRGRVLSVVDLVRFFDLPPAVGGEKAGKDDEEVGLVGEESAGPYLVVVNTQDMEVALMVDDVQAVETVPESRIRESTGTVRGLRAEYVRGVTERRARAAVDGEGKTAMVVVLELPVLLADERIIVHEEIV
jgi:purine-binding chemotaxis protein CheW